jgi:hypothetical protein
MTAEQQREHGIRAQPGVTVRVHETERPPLATTDAETGATADGANGGAG